MKWTWIRIRIRIRKRRIKEMSNRGLIKRHHKEEA